MDKESRLLTWEEWLNEKEGNIPFGKLDGLIQATMKAQYEYDKKERLAKQDTKSVKAIIEWGNEECMEHDNKHRVSLRKYMEKNDYEKPYFPRHHCYPCWQALKRSIENETT